MCLPASVKIVFEGDSITAQGYPTTAITYVPSGPAYTSQKIATSGYTAQKINTYYDSRAGAAFDATNELNILTLMAGTNDDALTYPVEIYRRLRLIMRKARATGYQRRLLGTLLSRNNSGGVYSGNTLPLNLAIRAMYNSDLEATGLFDFAANPLFDEVSDVSNLAYYEAAGTHPTPAGQVVLGGVLGPVLAAQVLAAEPLIRPPLTWSPYDFTGNHIALSGSDRIAERVTAGGTAAQIKAFNGVSEGKTYWEFAVDVPAGLSVGIFNRTYEIYVYSAIKQLINTADSIGCTGATGSIRYIANPALGSIGAFQAGDVIRNCLDMDAKRWWICRNSGSWNGNPLANPETGVGGFDISVLGAGPIYPAAQLSAQGGKLTSRFLGTEIEGPAPLGFSTIG